VKAPVLCLTATASARTRENIIKMLHMQKPQLVFLSPDKENIKYVVQMANKDGDLDKTFSWLINDLKDNGGNTMVEIQRKPLFSVLLLKNAVTYMTPYCNVYQKHIYIIWPCIMHKLLKG
jgi:hypothetical protein